MGDSLAVHTPGVRLERRNKLHAMGPVGAVPSGRGIGNEDVSGRKLQRGEQIVARSGRPVAHCPASSVVK